MEVLIDKKDPRALVSGYKLHKLGGDEQVFKKEEVLHFKLPNPKYPYNGMGVVEAGKTYIETEDYASTWTRNSIFNSGRPSGVLNVKGTMDDDQFSMLKKQFKDEYSGTKNAGKTLLVKGMDGLDYQKLGMEIGEVVLKDLKDMSRDDIMLMLKVSKPILGITEDVNRANAREARGILWENVIRPDVDRFIDHLNAFLMPRWDQKNTKTPAILNYENPIVITYEERLADWTAGHNKWLTTNDIRKERSNFLDNPIDDLPGGDYIREPISAVPTAGKNIPKRPTGDTGTNKPGDTGNSKPGDAGNGDTGTGDTGTGKEVSKKKELTELWGQRVMIFKQMILDDQYLWENRYKEVMVTEFESQQDEILSRHKKASNFGWDFNVDASNARILGEFIPMSIELMKEVAKYALDLADDPDTKFEIDMKIRTFITDRISKLAQSVNDQTIQAIDQSISEGIMAGEGVGKLRDRIQSIYSEATTMRAERIARTESLAASNEGANEAYRQSPMVTAKEWSAEADACETCQVLDGKIVGLDEDFALLGQSITDSDGVEHPVTYDDVGFPPEHPNCRCTILPVA
jgi:HK97 family phage portal protein